MAFKTQPLPAPASFTIPLPPLSQLAEQTRIPNHSPVCLLVFLLRIFFPLSSPLPDCPQISALSVTST